MEKVEAKCDLFNQKSTRNDSFSRVLYRLLLTFLVKGQHRTRFFLALRKSGFVWSPVLGIEILRLRSMQALGHLLSSSWLPASSF